MSFRADVRRIMRPDGAAWRVVIHEHDIDRGVVTIRRPKGWTAFAHVLSRALGWHP